MKHEEKICERCGTHFECKLGNITNCQCSIVQTTEATRLFLEKTDFDCLCRTCLAAINEKITALEGQTMPKSGELIEQIHYYMEGSYFVFTDTFHILRGYCCRSRCRHCPYGFNPSIFSFKTAN
ncbi:MAG: cysteine-rich CWC family protein [Saprospiraceae bacterium]|nr:cysteine-rich CWC family protein [Saprospiraceae bacterium]